VFGQLHTRLTGTISMWATFRVKACFKVSLDSAGILVLFKPVVCWPKAGAQLVS